MKRRVRAPTLICTAMALTVVAGMTPSTAAAGAGTVAAILKVEQPAAGIPFSGGCKATTYRFTTFILDGVFNHAGKTYAGQVKVAGATGRSSCDVFSAVTHATINSASSPASFSGAVGANRISGKLIGFVTRVGTQVLMGISLFQMKICSASGCTPTSFMELVSVAEFVPTQATAKGITQAAIVGPFVVRIV